MTLRQLALALLSLTFISISVAETTKISGTAPDFTLKTLSGENFRLAEQRGKIVMLNFWTTWCKPCRETMPLLEELQQRYQKAGLTVLGVNIEDTRSVKKHKVVDHVAKEMGVTFPILLDPQKQLINTIEKEYLTGPQLIPITVFIDRSGQVRYLHKGYKSGDKKAYKVLIKSLIRGDTNEQKKTNTNERKQTDTEKQKQAVDCANAVWKAKYVMDNMTGRVLESLIGKKESQKTSEKAQHQLNIVEQQQKQGMDNCEIVKTIPPLYKGEG